MREEPKPGDLIEIFRPLYRHWAIYVGDGYVIHLAPPSVVTGTEAATIISTPNRMVKVKKELLHLVTRTDKFRVNNKHDDKYQLQPINKIIQQAENLVGQEVPYRLCRKNSEHFVKVLRYGMFCGDQPEPKPGDLIEIFRPLYRHWAIYVGDGYVIHFTPPSEVTVAGASSIMSTVTERAIVKKELLYLLTGTDKFRVNNKHDDKYQPQPVSQIIQQAETFVGQEVPYSLIIKNCEHFVNALRYGVARSDQVRNGVSAAAVLLFAFMVL